MRSIWVMLNVVVWTLVLATGGMIASLIGGRRKVWHWITRTWSRLILWSSGLTYSVKGLENLDDQAHYVFVANHESAYDIPLAFAGIPHGMVPIAKKELRKIPFFGWAMIMAGHIFVDRTNHERALASLDKAREILESKPRSILLFPEGTRSLDGQIHNFKKGGIVLAIQTGIPVVPVAMCGTFDVLVKGDRKLKTGRIELRIGKPMDTRDITYEDRRDFTYQVRNEVMRLKSKWQAEQGTQA